MDVQNWPAVTKIFQKKRTSNYEIIHTGWKKWGSTNQQVSGVRNDSKNV